MKYEGIATTAIDDIERLTEEQMSDIDDALVAAAISMRDDARINFVHNTKNYDLESLKGGIMIGKLHKGVGESSIAIHAMGDKADTDTYKTRFFVLGAYHRTTRQGNYKGSVDALDTIEKSTDQQKLDDYINAVLK